MPSSGKGTGVPTTINGSSTDAAAQCANVPAALTATKCEGPSRAHSPNPVRGSGEKSQQTVEEKKNETAKNSTSHGLRHSQVLLICFGFLRVC